MREWPMEVAWSRVLEYASMSLRMGWNLRGEKQEEGEIRGKQAGQETSTVWTQN